MRTSYSILRAVPGLVLALSAGCGSSTSVEPGNPAPPAPSSPTGAARAAITQLGAAQIEGCHGATDFDLTADRPIDFVAVRGNGAKNLTGTLYAVDAAGVRTPLDVKPKKTVGTTLSMSGADAGASRSGGGTASAPLGGDEEHVAVAQQALGAGGGGQSAGDLLADAQKQAADLASGKGTSLGGVGAQGMGAPASSADALVAAVKKIADDSKAAAQKSFDDAKNKTLGDLANIQKAIDDAQKGAGFGGLGGSGATTGTGTSTASGAGGSSQTTTLPPFGGGGSPFGAGGSSFTTEPWDGGGGSEPDGAGGAPGTQGSGAGSSSTKGGLGAGAGKVGLVDKTRRGTRATAVETPEETLVYEGLAKLGLTHLRLHLELDAAHAEPGVTVTEGVDANKVIAERGFAAKFPASCPIAPKK